MSLEAVSAAAVVSSVVSMASGFVVVVVVVVVLVVVGTEVVLCIGVAKIWILLLLLDVTTTASYLADEEILKFTNF